MKKIYLFLYLLLMTSGAYAQTATAYGFTAFTSPYSSISGTGTSTTALGIDDATLTGIPIGFTFTFCGVNYTTLSASSNGWLSLANSSSIEYNNFAVLVPSAGFLMAYWDDLSGQVSTSSPAIPAYYSTTGVSPNRVFTFEWKNWSPYNYTGSLGSGLASFQIKLYETTNIIDFCYGPSTFAGMGATIGIANSTSDWQTLPDVSSAPVPSSSTFTNLLPTSPANNQVYRWSICVPPPITGTTSICVGSTSTLADPVTGGTWASANPSIATVGFSSGVLTGVATGTATISYTSTPGCVRTTVVTINPAPPAITGTTSVCVGATTTLSDAITGGTWVSGSTSIATVGPSSGIVTGAATGTAPITYTAPSGCTVTTIVTVNSIPAVITGTLSLCVGGTTTLSDVTSSGTWTSGNTSVATVIPGTGVVSGVAPGTAMISYTVSGCSRTAIVTVSAAPSPIGGTASVCVLATTTLTNTAAGGTWTSGATGVAVVTSSTGVVTGVASGTAVITYTTGSVCFVTRVVTVNAAPSAITGTLVVCAGASTTLADATSGGTWSSGSAAIATVVSSTGVVTGIAPGTAAISYTASTGCWATAVVTVNLSPAALSGTATVCEGATTTLSTPTIGGLWSSSNTSIATVGVISGVVTGVAAGTATISYVLGTGCYAVRTVTVNASPAAITGTLAVCQGLTTTLADATAGGTWTSSATGTASVGAATGIVSGVTPGTAVISYALTATGCFAAAIVTVNPLPAVISGSTSVCIGLNTTLSDATTGGTWASSATGTASVTTAGVVTGIAAGTAVITYTLPTGCIRTIIITVNPLPAAISGTATVCQGSTTSFTDATTGGTWSSSATGIATVGASSGVATGIAAGTAVISYTLSTGCYSTTVITVNATPASTGVASVCEGATTTLSNTLAGTWSSGNILIATVGASTGVVSGLIAGTAMITFTFTTGCIATTVVTVNPLPAAIGGTATVCIGLTTSLTDATPGGTWLSGSTGTATIVAATGVATGVASGTANITYTVTATGCGTTAVVTVDPLPSAITGASEVCVGSAITLSDATTGGTWSSSSTSIATAGAATGVITGVAAGTATITYTAPVTGCYITTIITVNPTPPAIGGPASVCIGATVTLTDAATGGTWISGNTAIATIGVATGIATGAASGTSTITYTAPTGCIITRALTVNPLPAAITGSVAFCQGSTITLNDATAGGTWSSSNFAIATVGVSSGVVTGVSGGTATVTYTSATGCTATTTVTVNPLPAGIGGSTSVCLGLTTTLTNTSPGGTWSSSNTTIATIGASSGIAGGVATGTATITYTLATGCVRTTTVTVNPLPPAITGTAQVCAGLTTTLSNASGGGTWSSSNTGVAVISVGTGVVTGIAPTTATITYTLPTSCIATTVVTVSPLPALIAGPAGVCVGSSVTLTDATVSGTWSSSNTLIATIGSSTGVISGAGAGTTTITYRLTTTGCEITRTETVNPLPAAITGAATVCGGGGTITLSDATAGGTWTSSNTAVATVGASTGIVTGVINGIATITYSLGTGCFSTTSISVNPTPPAVITPLGDTTVCPGDFVVLTANTGVGLTYQWYRAGVVISGAITSTYVAGSSGSYQVKVFNTLSCPAMSAPVLATVDTPVATVTSASGTLVTCAGNSITLDANTGIGLTYQWLHDAVAIAGATSASYTASASGLYAVVVTNSTGCSATDEADIIINPAPSATVTISGPLTFCQGGSVALTATAATGVTYQWHNAFGAIAGATTNVYTATVSGSYSVMATNGFGCTANSVVSVVVVNPLPNVAIMPGGPAIFCTGGNVALNATSGGGLSYQWYKGGVAIAGATNASYIATTGGGYRVRVTSSVTGCNDITHADTVVTVVGSPVITPLTPASFCWGGSALLATSVPAVSGVTYQWYRDGVAIAGATAPTYNAAVPGNYTCSISIPSSCTAVTTTMPVTERPLPNPVISYNAGTHVLSTQTYYVTYQWYKDLAIIPGATAATTVATGNAAYKVAVTDTNGCQSFSSAFPLTTWNGTGVAVTTVAVGEVIVYPNPAHDMVHVEAGSPVRVSISTVDGRTISVHPAAKTSDINISSLANGIYIMTIVDGSGATVKVEKLVKASE